MTANAATVDASALTSGAVAIALEDYTVVGTSHTEGPAYVGGDLNSPGPFYANSRGLPEINVNGVEGGLIVGADVNANLQKTGITPGSVEIGGSYNGNANTGGYEVNQGVSGIPVAEVKSLYQDLSAFLATFPSTPGAAFDTTNNARSFTSGSGDTDNLAFLNLSEAEARAMFSGAQPVSLNLSSNVLGFVINIAGTDFTGVNQINATVFENQLGEAGKVLLNFHEATDIDWLGNYNGGILAAFATVQSPSAGMNGTLIALNIEQDGAIRPIDGQIAFPGAFPEPETEVIPLPATAWMMLTGFGSLVALRRRRKSA